MMMSKHLDLSTYRAEHSTLTVGGAGN